VFDAGARVVEVVVGLVVAQQIEVAMQGGHGSLSLEHPPDAAESGEKR
jgi:hypothetical protein